MQNLIKIFTRLSKNEELENDKLKVISLSFYQKIIYDNWIFDMPKLIDMGFILSKYNLDEIRSLVQLIFQNEKRYAQDFKETIDILIQIMRNYFKKGKELINNFQNQDQIVSISDQEIHISYIKFLQDWIETLKTLEMILKIFPENYISMFRNNNMSLFLANGYCLVRLTGNNFK